MRISATRLGLSSVTLDWSHLPPVINLDNEKICKTWEKLKSIFKGDQVGFFYSPINNEISQLKESENLVKQILSRDQFTDCLFLGIGGSALGPISILSALDKGQQKIKFHFLENPDPLDWKFTLNGLKPETTLVCVVAKSGTTYETISQFLLALDWLGKNRFQSHIVAITDPEKGDLRKFARQFKIPTLNIHPAIGGRFSIFSPVGFFPMLLAGLKAQDFVNGAIEISNFFEKTPPEKNPIFILAHELIRHYPKRFIQVCMPYSTKLRLFGDWFVQMIGESLGKDGKGFTPIAALGATDQHSILQLLRDGPDDKITWFIVVDNIEDPVVIPNLTTSLQLTNLLPGFSILEGHSLHELLNIEYQATSLVLTRKQRPNLTIKLDQLDEKALGSLYFAVCVLTAFTGMLWDVSPFDQPGVEEGKIYIRNQLEGKN